MSRPKKKDDRFQPSPGTRRVVPMRDGWFVVHTPDGKAVRRSPLEIAAAAATYDLDDRTPGWYSAALAELGLTDVLAEVAQIKENNS